MHSDREGAIIYLLYTDESGDIGLANSQTRYFVLSGVVVHELNWRAVTDGILDFRKEMHAKYNLPYRAEIHASDFISSPGPLVTIPRYDRLAIIREFADMISRTPSLSVINIVVDKHGKPPDYDVFEIARKSMMQRFENTMKYRNFPGPPNPKETGMLLADHTDDIKTSQAAAENESVQSCSEQRKPGISAA